jgi:hypothetical protein
MTTVPAYFEAAVILSKSDSYDEAGVFDLRNTNQEMARNLTALPPVHQPGEIWDYGMSTDVIYCSPRGTGLIS